MRAAVFHGPGNVRIETVDDPEVELDTDVVVSVLAAGLCGADLWAWRGYTGTVGARTGHEFVGVVDAVGDQVRTLRSGDLVLAPPGWSDGTCENCLGGLTSSCVDGGVWGEPGHDGAHGERVRVPQADGTLLRVPERLAGEPSTLLAMTCSVPAAHHAAVSAGVRGGDTVVVVGDGAVGLCAVQEARRRGAARVVVVGHHDERLDVAKQCGADETVNAAENPAEAIEDVMGRTGGADRVLECAGTASSWQIAAEVIQDGGRIGFVGMPYAVEAVGLSGIFQRNVGLAGGLAPARAMLPGLLRAASDGRIGPAVIVDLVLPLDEIADGYAALDARVATKVRLTI
ncbi:MAG TPA: zinc-binding dehydrogenase [Jatrophihabitantaceae bacterium]|jgi:alcohol dehydrogenase|nr:zinc-binding dehydrogenase [Jatrophihabitantaceae bacterium]